MKKKLLMLGLAGAMLFSGISASAAVSGCGHPSVSIYYGGTTVETAGCKQHVYCELKITYSLEYATCHSCAETFLARKVEIGREHISTK